jgi:proline iminopeptidase
MLLLLVIQASIWSQEIKHPKGDYALVHGAKIWYESEGTGEPVLIIPGGPGNSHIYFHPYFSELAKSYRVIYFDAFGRGKSDRAKSTDEYTFTRDVEDVEGLRQALKIDKWIVLGHSYGGMVAQGYALKYPAFLRKLILSNTLFSAEMWQGNDDNSNNEMRNQYPELWEKLMAVREQGQHSNGADHQKLYSQIPSGLLYFYDASKAAKVAFDSLSNNTELYYAMVGDDGDFIIGGDMYKLDFRTQLKNLKMPTLIIEGRFDRVAYPKFSIQFKKYAPQADFVMFEKSGHLPFIEETSGYFETVMNFLKK